MDGSEDQDVSWRSWAGALQSGLPPLCSSITAILTNLGHPVSSPVSPGIDVGMCSTAVRWQPAGRAGSWPSTVAECCLLMALQRGELVLGTGHLPPAWVSWGCVWQQGLVAGAWSCPRGALSQAARATRTCVFMLFHMKMARWQGWFWQGKKRRYRSTLCRKHKYRLSFIEE